jgi:hypothetical protein
MDQTQAPSAPRYSEILKTVGQQIKLRNKDIFKRVILISWPVILLSITLSVLKNIGIENLHIPTSEEIPLIIGFSIIILIVYVYYSVVSSIFDIEKHLWLSSFFDGKNIASKQSWHMSWKLIIPVIGLSFHVFFRYYFVAIILSILCFFGLGDFLFNNPSAAENGGPMVLGVLFIGIVFIIYCYLTNVRLRFGFFLFLDMYNKTDFSYSNLFQELRKLNVASKGKSFRQALLINIGADSLRGITNLAIGWMRMGFNSLGAVGGILGAAARPFVEEESKQLISFARLSAIYVLYENASIAASNPFRKANEYVYSL